MSDRVNVNSREKTDFLANAQAAWGAAIPDWVRALAMEASRTSGAAAGIRIGYSGAVVTAVTRANYTGDLSRVEAKVRGALMGQTVECPIVGELRRDICLTEQKKDFVGTSEIRTQLYHACRSGCVHSHVKSRETSDA